MTTIIKEEDEHKDELFTIRNPESFFGNIEIEKLLQGNSAPQLNLQHLYNKTNESRVITESDLQTISQKLNKILEKIFNEIPNIYKEPNEPSSKNTKASLKDNGFYLEEIELNFSIDTGLNILFVTKANAGLTLKFKRK